MLLYSFLEVGVTEVTHSNLAARCQTIRNRRPFTQVVYELVADGLLAVAVDHNVIVLHLTIVPLVRLELLSITALLVLSGHFLYGVLVTEVLPRLVVFIIRARLELCAIKLVFGPNLHALLQAKHLAC